ncbi:hypothetical protein M9Y10_019756 [Tritrichomonas musculus]|uniref:Protein kinase domain-containing protein n=1 Tax=Tritrichomonas musculus TaxID=1915356 RepID=A0ABR2HI69_9EUKA
MQQDIFSDIPQDYNAKKDSVQDEIISNMYSKLTFLYLSPDSIRKHHLNDEENALNSPLFHFFENNKFISYEISEPSENLVKSKLFYDLNDPLYSYENFSQEVNVVICVEGKCLIIQSILKSIIFKIINKTRSTLINVSKNINNDFLDEEIRGFYTDICLKSKSNHFFQLTFKPILTFFVRRYFYPSSYFKDTSFFTFDQKYRTFEIESKKSISDLLLLNDEKQFDDTSASLFTIKFLDAFKESCFEDDGQISIQKFTKSDFIFLRKIYANTYYIFYLAIHIESLYIFMVKKLNSPEKAKIENEQYFCENIKHRCITRFYGFLYSDDSINGFVYEYMSNGTLAECFSKSKIPVNGMFKFMTICRIFQGMNHLHSNSIIHRDLKPSNIFLDHDFIPYVSDFDITRYLYKGGDFTNDFGSNLYSSPEQGAGEIISPSTDIYSFGLIIYFLFEEKNFFNEKMNYQSIEEIKKSDIVMKLNAPLNFQEIFLGCVKNDKDKRMSNNEILKRIYDEVYSFGYLEHFLFKRFDPFYNQELVNYLYENFVFVYRYDQDITQLKRSFAYLYVYFHLKSMKEKDGLLDFIFHLACVYLKDKFIKHDELKAIDYFKLAASKGHFNSIAILETFGIFDFSTSKNKMKSVDYLISAANRKDSDALFQLGNLYNDGHIVPKNERKAIECYSEAAELGNLNACLLVGNYYINQMNYEKAIHYLKLAGDHGNSDALLNLGDIYNEGKGVNVDHELAFKYFNLAASFNNPVALDRMGDLYANGQGVIQDKLRAIEYYESFLKFDYLGKFNNFNSGRLSQVRQHAEGLYSKFRAETFFKLGGIYLNDDGENFNIQKAIDCFRSSAELNNYKAQYILGEIYMNGHFGEIDYNEAKKFF